MPGALAGVRVLDFTIFQQGPQATLVMADMGADVIKIEPPGFGDLGRVLQMHGEHRISAYHLAHSRGKRSITVNLKTDGGSEIVRRLHPRRGRARPQLPSRRHGETRLRLRRRARAQPAHHLRATPPAGAAAARRRTHPAFDIAAQARSGLMSMTGEQTAARCPPASPSPTTSAR